MTIKTRPLKPVVPYHGGKGRLADLIVSLMTHHRVYLEPFAGSAAVLLAKPRSTHEVLNDIDGNVVAFYRVLRERPEDLERSCRLTPYARDEFTAAELTDPTIDDLERARRWFIRVTQGFQALTRPDNGWALSTKQGGADASGTVNRINAFSAVAERLSHVAIENRDALDLITAHQTPDSVIYADPPYLGSSRNAHADGYAHEFATPDDHRELARVLHASPAHVLLSGYPSPLYDELYATWERLERSVVRRSNNGHQSTLPQATEVIWSNRRLDVPAMLEFGGDA